MPVLEESAFDIHFTHDGTLLVIKNKL